MTAKLPLVNINALVTGGGSGIGLACAESLYRDGANVTLMGRSEQRLAEARAVLGNRCARPRLDCPRRCGK